ncbi:hypothetical protein KIPB_008641, partial [Kipferlia bialata]
PEIFTSERTLLQEFQAYVTTITEGAYYGGAVSHLTSSKLALQDRLDQGRATSNDTHASILSCATEAVLRGVRTLEKALTATINLPSQEVSMSELLSNVLKEVPLWQECLSTLDLYCDTLMSGGCPVPVDTHLSLARIAGFLAKLPERVESLAEVRKRSKSTMRSQMNSLSQWLRSLTKLLGSRCEALTSLRYDSVELETIMMREGREYPDLYFLHEPIKMPNQEELYELLRAVEKGIDRSNASDESIIQSMLHGAGLIVSFTANTGLPLVPLVRVNKDPGTHNNFETAVSRVPILDFSVKDGEGEGEGDTEGEVEGEVERPTPFQPYVRPGDQSKVSIESVLEELISLLDASRRGIALLDRWASDLNLPQASVSTEMGDVKGHPVLLHRASQLLRRASDTEEILHSLPVSEVDAADLAKIMSSMETCAADLQSAYEADAKANRKPAKRGAKKVTPSDRALTSAEAPNLSFAEALR